MGKRKQSDFATGTVSSIEATQAADTPLAIETPAIQTAAQTKIDLPKIESAPIGSLQAEPILAAIAAQAPAQAAAQRAGMQRYAFAASVAVAAVLGGLLGAAATAGFTRE